MSRVDGIALALGYASVSVLAKHVAGRPEIACCVNVRPK